MLAALDLATGKIYYRIRKRKRWREFLGLLKTLAHAREQNAAIAAYIRWYNARAEPKTRFAPEAPKGHQGTTPLSSNSWPVGPSSDKVASRMAIAAPCSGVCVPLNPLRSVAT